MPDTFHTEAIPRLFPCLKWSLVTSMNKETLAMTDLKGQIIWE